MVKTRDVTSDTSRRTRRRSRLSRESDDQLVTRFKAGNELAFECLTQRHAEMLIALCRSLCRQQADAEDAYQETLKAAWTALGTYEGRSGARVSTWLYRVCINATSAMYRRRVAEPVSPESFAVPTAEVDVMRTVTDAEVARQALNQLPDDFRTALVLADVLDLPYREIATLQFVSEATVKTRVFRARQAMKQLLGDER